MDRRKAVGAVLIALGTILGVGYSYVLLSAPPNEAMRILIISVVVIALLTGALIGAVGLILLRGFRVSGDES
ncbi:MAG: hypothetical protein F7C35_04490 [Desulfurococcales archaeon]|nr:hypothetical protein [Desulfurococcales archaeon]